MNSTKTLSLRIIKITALLLPVILVMLLMPINDFDDAVRLKNYYLEKPDSLDVIVMGSSENYAGYSPVLAYAEYGFTSYPFVLSANAFSLFEVQLEEALRVQSPEIVVVDIGEIVTSRNTLDSYDTVLRQFLAGIPFSRNKVATIHQYGDPENILSYYFPFIVNHGKADFQTMWQYIKTNAAVQRRGYSLLKGAITFTGSGENWDGPYVTPVNTAGDHSVTELTDELSSDVQRLLATCQKHPETTFLFINTPHRITNEEHYRRYQMINMIGTIIESQGYGFVNLESLTDKIGIQPQTDFYNNAHLNLYGQYKVTRFLCEILTQEYGLKGRPLSPDARENWETCAEYQQLYYQLFDTSFKSREPGEWGLWLQENEWLISTLEEMKEAKP